MKIRFLNHNTFPSEKIEILKHLSPFYKAQMNAQGYSLQFQFYVTDPTFDFFLGGGWYVLNFK